MGSWRRSRVMATKVCAERKAAKADTMTVRAKADFQAAASKSRLEVRLRLPHIKTRIRDTPHESFSEGCRSTVANQ